MSEREIRKSREISRAHKDDEGEIEVKEKVRRKW